ncbi:MAG: hypothetical protein HY791_00990 [Deltaproteobacteria bacterium]|nr:hypothetical protein [Deltaproteobacteria bacterium]
MTTINSSYSTSFAAQSAQSANGLEPSVKLTVASLELKGPALNLFAQDCFVRAGTFANPMDTSLAQAPAPAAPAKKKKKAKGLKRLGKNLKRIHKKVKNTVKGLVKSVFKLPLNLLGSVFGAATNQAR